MNKQKGITIRDICHIGIFTAVIAACAQISIPMPYAVPMTLQTLAVPLAGIILGAKKGSLSVLVYVLIGIVGVPVFSNFSGGPGVISGPTGGFLLSFPLSALITGIGSRKNKRLYLTLSLITGAVVNYLCGMLFFAAVMSSGLKTAFVACVLPFIPSEIIKIVLVAALGINFKTALLKIMS